MILYSLIYSGRKRFEYVYKRVKYGTTMSCVPPALYAQRFKDYMHQILCSKIIDDKNEDQ
jgi:hypothetical protein